MKLHYHKFRSTKLSLLRIVQGFSSILTGLIQVVSLGFLTIINVDIVLSILEYSYIDSETEE